jgi:hypothetical protein
VRLSPGLARWQGCARPGGAGDGSAGGGKHIGEVVLVRAAPLYCVNARSGREAAERSRSPPGIRASCRAWHAEVDQHQMSSVNPTPRWTVDPRLTSGSHPSRSVTNLSRWNFSLTAASCPSTTLFSCPSFSDTSSALRAVTPSGPRRRWTFASSFSEGLRRGASE